MTLIKIRCGYCGKQFLKDRGRVNEEIKFKWRPYCSKDCQIKATSNKFLAFCGYCNKKIFRVPSSVPALGICFCSRSCSAKFYNKSPKRQKKIRTCPKCGSNFIGRRKYCSPKCYPERPIFPAYKILDEIKAFYKQNGRIPVKREYHAYQAARFRFGTWNNAVKAAGLNPNPVLFAKKYFANDGHRCDSLSEKIIDDWLFAKKVIHEKNVPYLNTLFTADFKAKNIFIEFFGLYHELKRYDQRMKIKLKIIKDNNLKLIAIYPKDIFPIPKLDFILQKLKDETPGN